MSERIYNFSAGPAVLPVEVLREARENLLSLGDLGMGICEISHRSAEYMAIQSGAAERLKRLLAAGDEWTVLFLQGGASLQFAMIPQNLGARGDYVLTGAWSQKALVEARKLGQPRVAATSEETGFDRVPAALDLSPEASYVHITSNNTIYGGQWHHDPEVPAGVPLICDASSDILSRPLDVSRYGMFYAGSQKNLGPAGVTLVLVRSELLERCPAALPTMLNYQTHAKNDSLYNTPPTFTIYVVGLVLRWIEEQGGLGAMAERNQRKAGKLYAAIDELDLYQGHAQPDSRSLMNVTFRLSDPSLEKEFVAEATARGLNGLKGHRSVGGVRASIYNAMPEAGVDALVAFMREFAAKRG